MVVSGDHNPLVIMGDENGHEMPLWDLSLMRSTSAVHAFNRVERYPRAPENLLTEFLFAARGGVRKIPRRYLQNIKSAILSALKEVAAKSQQQEGIATTTTPSETETEITAAQDASLSGVSPPVQNRRRPSMPLLPHPHHARLALQLQMKRDRDEAQQAEQQQTLTQAKNTHSDQNLNMNATAQPLLLQPDTRIDATDEARNAMQRTAEEEMEVSHIMTWNFANVLVPLWRNVVMRANVPAVVPPASATVGGKQLEEPHFGAPRTSNPNTPSPTRTSVFSVNRGELSGKLEVALSLLVDLISPRSGPETARAMIFAAAEGHANEQEKGQSQLMSLSAEETGGDDGWFLYEDEEEMSQEPVLDTAIESHRTKESAALSFESAIAGTTKAAAVLESGRAHSDKAKARRVHEKFIEKLVSTFGVTDSSVMSSMGVWLLTRGRAVTATATRQGPPAEVDKKWPSSTSSGGDSYSSRSEALPSPSQNTPPPSYPSVVNVLRKITLGPRHDHVLDFVRSSAAQGDPNGTAAGQMTAKSAVPAVVPDESSSAGSSTTSSLLKPAGDTESQSTTAREDKKDTPDQEDRLYTERVLSDSRPAQEFQTDELDQAGDQSISDLVAQTENLSLLPSTPTTSPGSGPSTEPAKRTNREEETVPLSVVEPEDSPAPFLSPAEPIALGKAPPKLESVFPQAISEVELQHHTKIFIQKLNSYAERNKEQRSFTASPYDTSTSSKQQTHEEQRERGRHDEEVGILQNPPRPVLKKSGDVLMDIESTVTGSRCLFNRLFYQRSETATPPLSYRIQNPKARAVAEAADVAVGVYPFRVPPLHAYLVKVAVDVGKDSGPQGFVFKKTFEHTFIVGRALIPDEAQYRHSQDDVHHGRHFSSNFFVFDATNAFGANGLPPSLRLLRREDVEFLFCAQWLEFDEKVVPPGGSFASSADDRERKLVSERTRSLLASHDKKTPADPASPILGAGTTPRGLQAVLSHPLNIEPASADLLHEKGPLGVGVVGVQTRAGNPKAGNQDEDHVGSDVQQQQALRHTRKKKDDQIHNTNNNEAIPVPVAELPRATASTVAESISRTALDKQSWKQMWNELIFRDVLPQKIIATETNSGTPRIEYIYQISTD
ncbi:unnamed protein product [Amoebophrya sp. A120]|nr:unnamed protein product [Amoebophrya sp. A120]|eukprot:GSA120T00010546001.1